MACSRTARLALLALCVAATPAFATRPVGSGLPGAAMRGGGQGFLGVATRTVGDPVLAPLHLKETRGVCVVMVDHDSPAWKAGIREHDVLVTVAGTMIESEEQLTRLLHDLQPGRNVQVIVSRDGTPQTLNAIIADRDEVGKLAWEQHFVVPAPVDTPDDPAMPAPAKTRSTFGHSFVGSHLLPGSGAYTGAVIDEIGPQLAQFFGLKNGKGLLIQSVEANSPAANAGLHAGDVVCRVNGEPMNSRGDWTHALRDSKGHPVSVTVMRDRREQTLTIVPYGKHHSDAEQPGTNEHHWLAVLLVRPHLL